MTRCKICNGRGSILNKTTNTIIVCYRCMTPENNKKARLRAAAHRVFADHPTIRKRTDTMR